MPRSSSSFSRLFIYFLLAPIFAAAAFYLLDSFDPALVPFHEPSSSPVKAPAVNERMLRGSQKVGFGELNAPEEVLYDSESGFVYTGCEDGWIRRVKVSESETEERVVEDVINTGGRPLGIALRNDEIIVADADKVTVFIYSVLSTNFKAYLLCFINFEDKMVIWKRNFLMVVSCLRQGLLSIKEITLQF